MGVAGYQVFHQNLYSIGAGTHSFYVNAMMTSGASPNDVFRWGNVVAVYYPA